LYSFSLYPSLQVFLASYSKHISFLVRLSLWLLPFLNSSFSYSLYSFSWLFAIFLMLNDWRKGFYYANCDAWRSFGSFESLSMQSFDGLTSNLVLLDCTSTMVLLNTKNSWLQDLSMLECGRFQEDDRFSFMCDFNKF
jgi:hypothetical protein